MCRYFGLCELRSVFAPFLPLRWSLQGIAEHSLETVEKNAFFLMLRRLAGLHNLLPDRMVLKGKIEIPDGILASAGFGDVKCGKYKEALVAVKTVRVAPQDDLQKIRKVSTDETFSFTRPQPFITSDFTWKSFSGKLCPTRTS